MVTDDGNIPKDFWMPQLTERDRQVLHSALKARQEVPGVSVGDGGLTILVETKCRLCNKRLRALNAKMIAKHVTTQVEATYPSPMLKSGV